MQSNNHNFHEFDKIGENNTIMLTCPKIYQYRIKKEHDKTIAEIFDKEPSGRNEEKEQLRKQLIADYKSSARNKKLQKELGELEESKNKKINLLLLGRVYNELAKQNLRSIRN